MAWDHVPLLDELNRRVAAATGRPDAVPVFDPSASPKEGTAPVGVRRQWCGRLGEVDNCQVGVYLAYVSDADHAPVDFRGVRAWRAALPDGAWAKLTARDEEKGPLVVEVVARRVESKVDRRVVGFGEALAVVRLEDGGVVNHDDYLSNAAGETPWSEFARAVKAAHRVEGCLKRCKSEAGPGGYQVRNRRGWPHHQALSSLATWFLAVEARRGKKGGAGDDGPAGPCGAGVDPAPGERLRHTGPCGPGANPPTGAERVGEVRP